MSITPQRYCEEARYIGRMRPGRELFQAGLQRLAARATALNSPSLKSTRKSYRHAVMRVSAPTTDCQWSPE